MDDATEACIDSSQSSIQESAAEQVPPTTAKFELPSVSNGEKLTPSPLGEEKLVVVMVGLPARGKSYIARKVCRYLNWLQHPAKVFNVGEKRREAATKRSGGHGIDSDEFTKLSGDLSHTAAFFDPDDENAKQMREQFAMESLEELLQYLQEGGKVGIFDATNTTIERRNMIVDRVSRMDTCLRVLFIETQCFNQTVLSSNISLKLAGPDYKHADPVEALMDFNSRIWMYEKKYSPIGETEELKGYSYCQIIDVGRKTITYNINDALSTQTANFLQNFHLYPRQIWLTRHGESEDDVYGRLGGDSCLSVGGQQYAEALSRFISNRRSQWSTHTSGHSWIDHCNSLSAKFEIWTSQSQKSVQTAQSFGNAYHKRHIRILDELNAGALDGYGRCEIPHRFKEWFEKRQSDKLSCRYPGVGEKRTTILRID